MRLCVLLALLFPTYVLAQGTVRGHATNAASPEALLSEAAPVCAVFLPASAHPFVEITSATWQQAMDALAEGKEIATPFGRLEGGVRPVGSARAQVDGQGRFVLEKLPLETRIGIAVKVDGLWWPARQEVWLTADKPSAEISVGYCRLGAESPGLELLRMELAPLVHPDLKYAGIPIIETLRLTNLDPARGALVEIAVDLAMVPGTVARHLPTLYGSHLVFMQGWNLGQPVTRSGTQPEPMAWMLGGQTMHGSAPSYGAGPQDTPDNWHPLQRAGLLATTGAGDTLFRENPSPDGRGASLVFRRVVPPAIAGTPGLLELRFSHQAGARTADPGQRTRLVRQFPMALQQVEMFVADGISLQVLATQAHRKLLGEPSVDGRTRRYKALRAPALEAGEAAEWIIGFTQELQTELAALEARAAGKPGAEGETRAGAQTSDLNQRAVFMALAAAFGLAFLVALVASVRKSREQQLARLNRLPVTRDDMLAALRDLESDFKHGAIPATAYLDQKQRLLNRLVEHDAGDR